MGKIVELPTTSYHYEEEKNENIIGTQIQAARKKMKLSQDQLTKQLQSCGFQIKKGAISKWETGDNVPSAYQLIALCHVLEIENGLAYFTRSGARVKPRPELNETGLRKLAEYKSDLIATGRYAPIVTFDDEPSIVCIDVPFWDVPASAGTGEILDESNFEMRSFPKSEVPDGTDFALRVHGDSMEPTYYDGQTVWVQKCSELRPGEIGIFVYDGESYIKEYGERTPEGEDLSFFTDSEGIVHSQPMLISHNGNYDPKLVSPAVTFQIVGRVLN